MRRVSPFLRPPSLVRPPQLPSVSPERSPICACVSATLTRSPGISPNCPTNLQDQFDFHLHIISESRNHSPRPPASERLSRAHGHDASPAHASMLSFLIFPCFWVCPFSCSHPSLTSSLCPYFPPQCSLLSPAVPSMASRDAPLVPGPGALRGAVAQEPLCPVSPPCPERAPPGEPVPALSAAAADSSFSLEGGCHFMHRVK